MREAADAAIYSFSKTGRLCPDASWRSFLLLNGYTVSPLPTKACASMATAPRLKPRDDLYIRRIIHGGDKTLLESRCSRCGALVIGSVPESLIEDEGAHLRECPNRRFGPSPQR
jgi:hypothetical protein